MFNIALLMGALFAIFLVLGYIIGWALGFPVAGMSIAFAIALVINLAAYWFSDSIVLKSYGAKPSENAKVKEMLAYIAKEAKISTPRLYEVDSKAPNAFATGRNQKRSVVAVTKGLLELKDDEIEGVLAHEVAHIKNRDMLVSTMAAVIGGAIAYLAQMGYYMAFSSDSRDSQGGAMAIILMAVFAPIAALLVRLAISRGREYGADRTGALLSKKPKALASALRKISDCSGKAPMRGPAASENLWIVNPFHSSWFTEMFSTHPPIQKRIELLEGMAGE